jgi:hypothetical protein
VEIPFAIIVALTASKIADIDPKGNRYGGTGWEPKLRCMVTIPGNRSGHLMHKQSTQLSHLLSLDNRFEGL